MRKILFLVIFASSIFTYALASQCNISQEANDCKKGKPTEVNILTWWGYLDSESSTLKKIADKCNARISFDDYYSYEGFVNRMKSANNGYDIIIFSDTTSKTLINKIALPNSTLYKVVKDYMPTTRKHYLENKYPHNVVYFQHAIVVLVYNPKVITLNDSDTLYKLFKKSGHSYVVMIDDPLEASMLLNMASGTNNIWTDKQKLQIPLTIENFRKLTQNTDVFITNTPQKIFSLSKFAFALQWSGDAIKYVDQQPGLKLHVSPALSYVTSDLLAELNTEPATSCVARELASKKFLNAEENSTFYISPYGGPVTSKNKLFKRVYEKVMKNFSSLPWIHRVSPQDLSRLKKTWEMIKYQESSKPHS